MTRRSSISIGYDDLLNYMQKQLTYQEARYKAARGTGGNLNGISHEKECAETLVRMLKRCEKGKQADLFALFNETKV